MVVKGQFPFLDKFKLKDGMPWKDGFLQGLKGSKCFISLISRKALESCRDKSRNHTWDNVLLEIETALRYKSATGNAGYIVPVNIGEWLTIDGVGRLFKKFDEFGGNLYAFPCQTPFIHDDRRMLGDNHACEAWVVGQNHLSSPRWTVVCTI